jgi:hypothetical protein
MGCELPALRHGSGRCRCDAADGAARELYELQLVGAKQFPAVAVPCAAGRFAGLEQSSPEPDQDHDRADTGRQRDELWSKRDHVVRPSGAPSPVGPTIV